MAALDKQASASDFWDKAGPAQRVMRQASRLRREIGEWEALESRAGDAHELAGLGDDSLRDELAIEIESLEKQTKNLKLYTDQQTEALARIVNKAFSAQNKYLAQVFASRADLQQLREQMAAHDRKFEAIEQALDVKL